MWDSFFVNSQNIKAMTGKAVLIALPHKSEYDGYKFWISTKLVDYAVDENAARVIYNDKFTFKLRKYGNGKYNQREIIDEIEISAAELARVFTKAPLNCAEKKAEPIRNAQTRKIRCDAHGSRQELDR